MGWIGAHCKVEDSLAMVMGKAMVVMLEVLGINRV